MASETLSANAAKWMRWTGYAVSALPVLMLLFSGVLKLLKPAMVVESLEKYGYPESITVAIGLTELVCTALYLIPRTTVLGAILLTGYLGGATATHVRVGEAFVAPVVVAVMLWLGLYLREARLRALLPLRN